MKQGVNSVLSAVAHGRKVSILCKVLIVSGNSNNVMTARGSQKSIDSKWNTNGQYAYELSTETEMVYNSRLSVWRQKGVNSFT